jgi:hypothetical protein
VITVLQHLHATLKPEDLDIDMNVVTGVLFGLLLPWFALIVSSLCCAFPAHYYAVRYPPWVTSALQSSRSRSGRRAVHLRDVTPTSPEQVIDLLRSAYTKDHPVVIRGGVAHWPAAGTWSPKHIAEQAGRDEEVELQTGVQEQESTPFLSTTLGWFADWMTEGEKMANGDEQEERDDEEEADKEDKAEETEEDDGAAKISPRPAYYMAEEFDWVEHHSGLVKELRLEEMHAFWQNEALWNDGDVVVGLVNRLLGPWWESRSKAEMAAEIEAALGTHPASVSNSSPSRSPSMDMFLKLDTWIGNPNPNPNPSPRSD